MLSSKKNATAMSCFLPTLVVGVSLFPFGNLNAQKLKQLPSTPIRSAPEDRSLPPGPQVDQLPPSPNGWRPVFSLPSSLPSSSPRNPSAESPPVQKSAGSPLRPFGVPSVNTPLAQRPAQIPTGKAFGKQSSPVVQPDQIPKATTAEELLQQLTDRPTFYYLRPSLSAEELEKSVEQLRERFPFRSIRDRLYFVDGEPTSKTDDKQDVPFYANRYASALRDLHSEKVQKFITQEGFGVSRISPVSPADLFPRDHYAYTPKPVDVDSSVLHEEEIELDKTIKMRESRMRIDMGTNKQVPDQDFINSLSENGLPKQQLLSTFNARTAGSFATRTGYLKDIDQVAGFEAHRIQPGHFWSNNLRRSPKTPLTPQAKDAFKELPEQDRETSWKVNRIELVSLLMHDKPCVYDTDELPNMEELNSDIAQTRTLTAFESEGLKALESGEEMLVRATKNRIVMVGAIRATGNCLQCHSGETKDLLGAFSYEFLRSPAVGTSVVEQGSE